MLYLLLSLRKVSVTSQFLILLVIGELSVILNILKNVFSFIFCMIPRNIKLSLTEYFGETIGMTPMKSSMSEQRHISYIISRKSVFIFPTCCHADLLGEQLLAAFDKEGTYHLIFWNCQ